MFIKRRELVNIMTGCESSGMEEKFSFLTEEIAKRAECDEEKLKDLKKELSYFKSDYKSRWMKAHRTEAKFQSNNEKWLDSSILLLRCTEKKRGRPETSFQSSSERTKRLKTKQLRDTTPLSVLTYATQMTLRAEGQPQASKLLKEITTSPESATRYTQAYRKSLDAQEQMSGQDALGVLANGKFSRHQYSVIRSAAPEKFPSYKKVQAAKKLCYPKSIQVTDTCAFVSLQALLDHTVERLLQTVEPVIESLGNEELNQLCLLSKWGFDGSSGHSSYKQAFHGSEASDAAVFITCLVPLRLISGAKIIWQNPRPASTRYCRPLKIEFIKETTEVSIAEKNRVDEEIKNLKNSNILNQGRQMEVSHNLIFAMVDGKVCNALTATTSTQKCYICGATSKQFNNINEMILRKTSTENFGFGLSVLHGWIRMFECLLHLAYKLPLKKWQARGSDKEIVAKTKAQIQKEFKERCGLIVDKPKPGFGNTNDGNTARRFFQNAKLSAEITKVDIDLINKLHIIMIVVASGHEINVPKFRVFTQNTARYFVEKYPWFNMPPTLHKYFIHGPEIISSALLPIGQLTEEAQEARNKDFKKYREHNARKCSRKKANTDIFNFFLVTSDPVITSKHKLQKKKIQHLPSEVLDLLKDPAVQATSHDDNDDNHIDDVHDADDDDLFSNSEDE